MSGIPDVPSGCRPNRAFTFLSTWRKISQVWCQCPDLGNVCSLGAWVGDLVTRVCPKPPQPPQLLEAQQSFSTSSPIATSTLWFLAEVCQPAPAQRSCLLVSRERFRPRCSLPQLHILKLPPIPVHSSCLTFTSWLSPLSTGAAIAGVYRAAGKKMIPFEALIFGVGQTFCVVVVSFLRILATL